MNCPHCGTSMPDADITPETGISICHSCQGIGIPANQPVTDELIGRYPRITFDYNAMSGRHLVYHHRDWASLLISIIFFLFFIPLFRALISDKSAWNSGNEQINLALILFLAFLQIACIIVIYIGLLMAFGKTIVEIDRGQGKVTRGVGPLVWSWPFTLQGNMPARVEKKPNGRDPSYLIVIRHQPNGKNFRFGWMINRQAAAHIAAWLNANSE